ncbi:MAG: gamma-glutamyl-gamma-aminobutyrate hydrolase family protein, partial [Eudoraea sp.]|nr:gamma-glutamyl-gamma-aminobutyrate hydrolase family protein [Eudoraea sp.]
KLKDANSTEMDEYTDHPVISLMEEQKSITNKGGTMRLGAWECEIKEGSLVHKAYHGRTSISERHRHRYEFNNDYKEEFEKAGMLASGINTDTGLVEIIEIPSHPWFLGVQYHPEYKSTVANPHPLFVGFVKAVLLHKRQQTNASLA